MGTESKIDEITKINTKNNKNLQEFFSKDNTSKREVRTDKYVRFKVPRSRARSRSLDLESSQDHEEESEGVRLDLYSHYSKRYGDYETEPNENFSLIDTDRNFSVVTKYQSEKEINRYSSFQTGPNLVFTDGSERMKDNISNVSLIEGQSRYKKGILVSTGVKSEQIKEVKREEEVKGERVGGEEGIGGKWRISGLNMVLSVILVFLILVQIFQIFGPEKSSGVV